MWADIKKHRHFYLFISPFFILFGVFGLYPLLFSLYISLFRWDGLTPPLWAGLDNYARMLQDETLWTALWNTLVIGMLYAPPMLILAFIFALWLNAPMLRLKAFFRGAFFVPVITPMVVIAMVFSSLYGLETGLINQTLIRLRGLSSWLDFEPVPWLDSPFWSRISIALLVMWRWTGYNMVLMLAGLQGITPEYYEAATVDGAGRFQRLWHITIPLMAPTFLFCVIMSLIGTVYMFDEVFVLTRGGPGISSMNFGLYLFNVSFVDFRFGYASAVAYTVALAVFLISLSLMKRHRTDHG